MNDLISRQAAIDALAKFVPYAICDESTESYTNGLTDAYNLILQLPSAQPKRIRGQWSIKGQAIDTVRGYWATCSACGRAVFGGGNYCANCGSYNKGEVEQ